MNERRSLIEEWVKTAYCHPVTGEPCGFNQAHAIASGNMVDHMWAIYHQHHGIGKTEIIKRRMDGK